MKWRPGGKAGRTAAGGESSDLDIRVPNVEVYRAEEREWWRPDSLEKVSQMETEWKAMPGSGGGTESREPFGYRDSIDDCRNSEAKM
ncbi:hypothetical protein NDU88_006390 [Pleurodeles waltl]|uniref:Uncharacterized protein n=1 Tax=Pleurodeles waltl TaxID=8319 RepID=A0AAV7SPG5_PLEWA|nr:hypothetical protein NDU88_006390 [Pleurodeles waltl]